MILFAFFGDSINKSFFTLFICKVFSQISNNLIFNGIASNNIYEMQQIFSAKISEYPILFFRPQKVLMSTLYVI